MSEAYEKGPARHLYENRILYLSGDIATPSAEGVIAGLFALDAIDPEAEIKLYLSSFGGSVYGGLAIYDAMMMIRAPVSTLCVGPAFSMAAWLLAAGTPGRRFATANARVMLHQATAGFAGTTGDIRVAAENILQNQDLMTQLLALHTGHDPEVIGRAIERDLWMTAEQAKAFGIVDDVIPVNHGKLALLRTIPRRSASRQGTAPSPSASKPYGAQAPTPHQTNGG